MRLKKRHIAGIIPVAGKQDTFGFEWPDCMMPLAPNYACIERSVLECAYAGCKTIWIICNDDVSPVIKHRVGEFVYDPVYHFRMDTFPNESRRVIPIFYIPVNSKDVGKRDCMAWSIIYGSLTAFKIGSAISKWVAPHRYYVSFPYGIYDPSVLRAHRDSVRKDAPFALSYDGKTVKDNEYLGFSFGKEEWLEFRRVIRQGTGRYSSEATEDTMYPRHSLPLQERYSARHFTLDKVLESVNIDNKVELPFYYTIETWEQYLEYMSSENILKTSKYFLTNGRKIE